MAIEESETPQAVLLYELDTLADSREVFDFAVSSSDSELRRRLKNAAIESMLVHARTLIEFLIGRQPRPGQSDRRQHKDDVLPSTFTRSWQLPSGGHQLDKWLDLIDKHLAHMTTARTAFKPEWPDEILREIADVLERFVDAVEETDTDFGASLAERLGRLRSWPRQELGHGPSSIVHRTN